MFRPSELKKLNNLLWSINTKLTDNVQNYIDIAYQVKNIKLEIEYKDLLLKLLELDNNLGHITLNANLFRKNFTELYNMIDKEIDKLTQSFLYNPKNFSNGEPYSQVKDPHVERKYRTDITKYLEEINYKISAYTSWQYSALQLGCKDGILTKNLVAADPLYIADFYAEYLAETKNQFNSLYQNRLCIYKLNEQNFVTSLRQLPEQQFSFILGWDTLEHFSFDYLRTCLELCKKLLRPGGVIMFNYNNCDKIEAIKKFEFGLRPWITAKLITQLAEQLDLTIVNHINKENDLVDWIELKLPGELDTVKAHQVLGEFCNIT